MSANAMKPILRPMRARQRGWLGLVVMLVALVIVAVLAKEALKQYGLLPGKPTAEKAGTPGERARAAGAVGIDATDLNSAPQTPGAALDDAVDKQEQARRSIEELAA